MGWGVDLSWFFKKNEKSTEVEQAAAEQRAASGQIPFAAVTRNEGPTPEFAKHDAQLMANRERELKMGIYFSK